MFFFQNKDDAIMHGLENLNFGVTTHSTDLNQVKAGFRGYLDNSGLLDDLSARDAIGLIKYIAQGNEAVFRSQNLNIEDYADLRNRLIEGNWGELVGQQRFEATFLSRNNKCDQAVMFGEALKELLTGEDRFSETEKLGIAQAIKAIRIDNIKRSFKGFVEEKDEHLQDISCEQAIGLAKYILQGDEGIFTAEFTSENHQELRQYVDGSVTFDGFSSSFSLENDGVVASGFLLGGVWGDIHNIRYDDQIYLLGEGLKSCLIEQNNFNDEEKEQVAQAIQAITHPSFCQQFSEFAASVDGKKLLMSLAGTSLSLTWGIEEGFPVDTTNIVDLGNDRYNEAAFYVANTALGIGLLNVGPRFVDEVMESLSGNNSLAKRVSQLGAVMIGVATSYGLGDQELDTAGVFSLFGAAMVGVSVVNVMSQVLCSSQVQQPEGVQLLDQEEQIEMV